MTSPVRTDPTVQCWFTTAEAATYIRMSTYQLRRYALSGVLRGEQVGGRRGPWRFHREWLDAFMSRSGPSRKAS